MSMSSGDLTIRGISRRTTNSACLCTKCRTSRILHSRFSRTSCFSSGGRQARIADNSLPRGSRRKVRTVCAADYEFAAPVDTLDVDCTFHAVTVPNHVHLLRVENGGKRDQALFDISFPRATLRFRPPTALETAVTQAGGGFCAPWAARRKSCFWQAWYWPRAAAAN